MAKVTSKLQVTIPKAIADRYGIRPGDNLEWVPAGEAIRVLPANGRGLASKRLNVEERLRLFDETTRRQKRREAGQPDPAELARERAIRERGWRREDLYTRGSPR